METPVKSPCVSVCALDENDICMGCYRSVEEIARWSDYSETQKRDVIRCANQRCRERFG